MSEETAEDTFTIPVRTPYCERQGNIANYKVVIIPPSRHITPDTMTVYEQAQVIYHRVKSIASGAPITLDEEDMYINTSDIGLLNNSDDITLVEIEGQTKIKLENTIDIAKAEMRLGKSPMKIMREIQYKNGIIYVEVKMVNDLIKLSR